METRLKMANPWFWRLLCFWKSLLEITTKSIEKEKDHSPGRSNGVFNCIKYGRCKEQRRFSYRLRNEHYREPVLRNRHQETQGLKMKPCWETHPTRHGESRPLLPCARERKYTSDEQNRITTKRESDLLINQEYDYKQNWTTRGPMKDEL